MSAPDDPGAPLPFTRLGGAGGASGAGGTDPAWWSWILDLDPFAPATVTAGPAAEERAGPAEPPEEAQRAEGSAGAGTGPGPDERARRAAVAGHRRDPGTARELATDPEPRVRMVALGALDRMGALKAADLAGGLADPDPTVRRRACELAASQPEPDLRPQLEDTPEVAEMAAWALGERGGAGVVPELSRMAGHHPDALCREAAVAALGAIGDTGGLPAILAALDDRPAVRRRAVIALAPFEGPEVDAALAKARSDRDWQVRQAAEDLS